jgi:hypothetical protein
VTEKKKAVREYIVHRARIQDRDPLILVYRAGTKVSWKAPNGNVVRFGDDENVVLHVPGPGEGASVSTDPAGYRIPELPDPYGGPPTLCLVFDGPCAAVVDDDCVRVTAGLEVEVLAGAGAIPPGSLTGTGPMEWYAAEGTDPAPHDPGKGPK